MPVISIERVWKVGKCHYPNYLVYCWRSHRRNERIIVINPIGSPERDCPFSGSPAASGTRHPFAKSLFKQRLLTEQHIGFECELTGAVETKTRNSNAPRAAANMDQEASAAAADVRPYGAINAHGTKEICVKNALRLFERAGFSQAQEKVTRLCSRQRRCGPFVLDDVNSTFDGRTIGNVEFEDVQLKRFAFRQFAQLS
jgi:hypothetical protein